MKRLDAAIRAYSLAISLDSTKPYFFEKRASAYESKGYKEMADKVGRLQDYYE